MQKITYAICLAIITFSLLACDRKTQVENNNTTMEETAMAQPKRIKDGPKSVLIISSSPRRGGNSELLCEQFKKMTVPPQPPKQMMRPLSLTK